LGSAATAKKKSEMMNGLISHLISSSQVLTKIPAFRANHSHGEGTLVIDGQKVVAIGCTLGLFFDGSAL